jgi:hypothetical protein
MPDWSPRAASIIAATLLRLLELWLFIRGGRRTEAVAR